MTTVHGGVLDRPDVAGAPHGERTIRVARTGRAAPADGDGTTRAPGTHWDRFTVPVTSARMTVLDALMHIRARLDPTLDVRHSCFHASCGTCGMHVDGRDVLGCVTRLADLPDGEIDVAPLRNQAVVSDLVVDLEALYEGFDAIGMPLVRTSDLIPASRPADGVPFLGRFEDCIECGLCVSACPVECTDGVYAGPAVLGAAWRVIEEPRDADPDAAFAFVDGDQGAWRCHLAFECSEACPSDALPAEHIVHLRRGLLRHRLAALFGRRGGGSEGSA